MWSQWLLVIVGVLVVGAVIISLFMGGLVFGLAFAAIVGLGLLVAAAVRRTAGEPEGAGAGLSAPPRDTDRFGEGAKDRGSASVPQREEAR